MVFLHHAANLDGLVHVPQLVDVAHQVDVRADAFAQRADAGHLAGGGGFCAHLGFHLAEALLNQPGASLGQILYAHGTHQSAAGVGGRPVAVAAQQRANGLVQRLALDVPHRNIDGGQGQGQDAFRPGRCAGIHQPVPQRLRVHRVFAGGQGRQIIHRPPQRVVQRAAEEGNADTLNPFVRVQLQRNELSHAGLVEAHYQRVVGRGLQYARGGAGNFHGGYAPLCSGRDGGGIAVRRLARAPGASNKCTHAYPPFHSSVPTMSLRASFDRLRTYGKLDEVEHTPANRSCYHDENPVRPEPVEGRS